MNLYLHTLMSLLPPLSSPAPVFAAFTQNGESAGSVVGYFDLLCLSGVIISVLEDGSFATSTGTGQSALHLYVGDVPDIADPENANLSVNSANSSALMAAMPCAGHAFHADASTCMLSFDEAVSIEAASLLLALGGFVALLMKNAAQCAAPDQA